MDYSHEREVSFARNRCDLLRHPNYINLALSIFILFGIFVSYLSQHYRIISRRTSKGISPYFILLGVTSGNFALTNILTLPESRADISCCKIVTGLQCIAGLLGIAQVFTQWVCFSTILILFVRFSPRNRGQANFHYDNGISVTWHDAVRVALFCLLNCIFLLTISVILLLIRPNYLSIWANCLGVLAAILAVIQYLPQIWTTWHLKSVGSLSIPMMLIQAPGSLVWSGSLAVRLGIGGWSTWGLFLVTGCLQGCILAMGIYFELSKKNSATSLDESRTQQRSSERQVVNQWFVTPELPPLQETSSLLHNKR